jgi:dihydropyrimidinase
MIKSVLIKGGSMVIATGTFPADLLVVEGKIAKIGDDLEVLDSNTEIIDATGLIVLPGGIDAHVHMELPVAGGIQSADDFLTGSAAAIAGGTTTIIDFITPEPGQSLIEATEIRKKAAKKSLCNVAMHMSVTQWNDNIPEQLKICKHKFDIHSIKVYMAYKKGIGLNDDEILKVMDVAASLDMIVMLHCEHDEIIEYLRKKFIAQGKTSPAYHPLSRPPKVEGEAVRRAILMAGVTDCPIYIVHVSTREAEAEIAHAQASGKKIFAETCPHYLLLDHSEYKRPGFEGAAYVMSPPLRSQSHKHDLWQALKEGTIQTVATDHCPFNMKIQKEIGKDDFTKIPNGVAGVQHRLELLYSYGVALNKLSLKQWVDVTATQPAKIFKLHPQKGILLEGSDADIVLWDPEAESTISAKNHFHNCDTSIYEGFKIKGKAHTVLVNGRVAFREPKIIDDAAKN